MSMNRERGAGRGRRLLLAGLWLVLAGAAMAISDWAVGLASGQVTDPIHPAALSDVVRSTPPPSPVAPPGPAAAAPPEAVPEGTTPPRATPAAVTANRTVVAVGGRAAFRFEGGRVILEWATPAPGFQVDIEDDGREVRVRFRGDDHESRIWGSFVDGDPDTRVEERPDD